MKKRILSCLMAMALCLTLLPTGALAAPMLLADDSPNEQFSLTPGGRYYFDLSGASIPGTVNTGNEDGAV
ncbi:hypothetical protein AAAV51_00370, partial [Agathobaculum butyriciproducens]|uniref:hypothetical protein n=1 Tax=Agathobaculum butyriciproducens TaxID=1628085 RepID=UPI0032C07171